MQTRGLVMRGESDTAACPTRWSMLLEARHLIRADVRAGARWYELVHDRLVDPILQSNREWEAARQTPLRLTAQTMERRQRRRPAIPGQDARRRADLGRSAFVRGRALRARVSWSQPTGRKDAQPVAQPHNCRVAAAVIIAAVMTYLAVTAERAKRVAEQQRQIALSRQLAAQTLTQLDDKLDLALLLGLAANRLTSITEIKSSLLAALTDRPKLVSLFARPHQSGAGRDL